MSDIGKGIAMLMVFEIAVMFSIGIVVVALMVWLASILFGPLGVCM